MSPQSNIPPVVPMFREEVDIGRRRLQKNGDLYKQGGYWKLRWKEDTTDEEGNRKQPWSKPVWLGPCEGKRAFTEKEAQRLAWDNFLSKLDQNNTVPKSMMMVGQFFEKAFVPERVMMLKDSGAIFYRTMLKHVVTPDLGEPDIRQGCEQVPERHQARHRLALPRQLRDVNQSEVQRINSAARMKGYAPATINHIRSTCSAIFMCAKAKQWFAGDNPAESVTIPEIQPVRVHHAFTLQQAKAVLDAMVYPEYRMTLYRGFDLDEYRGGFAGCNA